MKIVEEKSTLTKSSIPNNLVRLKKKVLEEKVLVEKVTEGVPDNTIKTAPTANIIIPATRRVGISKGATLSVAKFEFVRLDCWIERVVPDTDRDTQKALMEMTEIVDNYLIEEAEKLERED